MDQISIDSFESQLLTSWIDHCCSCNVSSSKRSLEFFVTEVISYVQNHQVGERVGQMRTSGTIRLEEARIYVGVSWLSIEKAGGISACFWSSGTRLDSPGREGIIGSSVFVEWGWSRLRSEVGRCHVVKKMRACLLRWAPGWFSELGRRFECFTWNRKNLKLWQIA